MQTIGYVILDNQKVLVLVRARKYGRSLKLRKTGKDGIHFSDEQVGLQADPELKAALLNNQVVNL